MRFVTDKNKCCGCMACKYVCPKQAIVIKTDSKGFAYPVIDKNKCVECGKCSTVCSFNNGVSANNFEKKVFAVKNNDIDERMKSSSGGVFGLLAKYIFDNGGVVYGAAYTANDTVSHIRCDGNVGKLYGSKYVQSNMDGVYGKIKIDLDDGKKVLFSGTPCQVAQVKSLFEKYCDQLYLVEVICHGVPSPGIFKEHIKYCEKKSGKKVDSFLFRMKDGRCKNQKSRVVFSDGSISDEKYIGVYFNIFNENYILRESCFSCPYACTDRKSDITIGDFWGINDCLPKFDDGYGVSATLVNSKRGEELFGAIENCVDAIETDLESVAAHNPNLKRPTNRPQKNFWIRYRAFGYFKTADSYINPNGFKKLISRLLRVIRGR